MTGSSTNLNDGGDGSSGAISEKILDDLAIDIVNEIQHEIVSAKAVFTRKLFESWQIEKLDDNKTPGRLIGSELLYARVLDEGRLPGKMPPVNALFPWVRDKFPSVHSDAEAKRVAFAVAKKIAEEGIEPRNYVDSALFTIEKESVGGV